MGLQMKDNCEKCYKKINNNAFICVHECTFCEECTKNMEYICPNCTGELVIRPKPPKQKCPIK